jgi:hypothetical protein
MLPRRRYSSASSALVEDSLSTELHFVYLSEDESASGSSMNHNFHTSNNNNNDNTTDEHKTSSEEEDDEQVLGMLRVDDSKGASSASVRSVLSKEDKERRIEQTLEQWGAPKREMQKQVSRDSINLESSAEKIKNAVEVWAGSPTKVKEARQLLKEQERKKKERVRVVVNNWSDGPPFLHAVIEEHEVPEESGIFVFFNVFYLKVVRPPSSSVGAGRSGGCIDLSRVLLAVRTQGAPRADDISRMASSTVVKVLIGCPFLFCFLTLVSMSGQRSCGRSARRAALSRGQSWRHPCSRCPRQREGLVFEFV